MKISILTLFPEMFDGVLSSGVIGRAAGRGLLEFSVTNIRDFSGDKHRKVDDYPFGGGAGQLMTVQPIFAALRGLGIEPGGGGGEPVAHGDDSGLAGIGGGDDDGCSGGATPRPRMLYPSPRGRRLDHALAEELSLEAGLVLLCGHYEGVDQRALDAFGFEEISIGDYILTGGEVPSMVLIDTVCRLIPGVLGSDESHAEESIYSGLLEYPQYTRPSSFEGMDVPEALLSGDHARIALWNFEQALKLTAERRPDLLRAWLAANYDGLDKKRKALAAPYCSFIRR